MKNWIQNSLVVIGMLALVMVLDAQFIKTASTLSELATSTLPDARYPYVRVLGWASLNDGGGGTYKWDTTSTVTATNYGAVASTRPQYPTGYWIRMPGFGDGTAAPRTQTLINTTKVLAEALAVKISAASAITNEAHPSIATNLLGNGQRLRIIGSGSNTIIFRDEGTDAGTLLQLGASTRTVGPGDILDLEFNSTDSSWYETGFVNN